MRVATLTLSEQVEVQDLRTRRKLYYEAGTQLGDLMRQLGQRHFSIPPRPFNNDKLTVDQTGKYIILE